MPILLLHGNNSLEIDEAARAVRQSFQQAGVLTFEGPDVSFSTLSEACLTAGLFDLERLVIVHNLQARLKGARQGGAEAQELASLFSAVPDSTTLLLICRDMEADHPLVRMVREAGGTVRAHLTPRRQELPRWIATRARKLGITLDPGVAELLADQTGENPLALDSELQKLVAYAGEEQRVTPPMVETLVGAIPQDSIFTLVDAIAAGDKATALRLLHDQLDRASSSPTDFALYLIRLLARQMRILLRIRLGREAGRSSEQLTAELKLPRYYANRYFRQASRLSQERLTAAFEQLAALEHALKSGKIDAPSGLDLLVADLCC